MTNTLITVLPRLGIGGRKFNQIFMAVMVNIPLICFGMFLGWTSPMQAIIQSVSGPLEVPVSDEEMSWIASIVFITSIPLEFVMGFVADHYGRKVSVLASSLSIAVCWLVTLLATQPWHLILARALGGFGCAGCYVITPLYVKEISEDSIRGALGSMMILSQNLGYVIIYVMGDLLSYDVINCVCFVLPLIHFVAFFAMPETPPFLIKQGRKEDSQLVLSWLRGTTLDDKEITEESKQMEEEHLASKDVKYTTIVTDKTTFRAFRIALIAMVTQESCGYIIVLLYAGFIFEKASSAGSGISLSPNQQTVVLGVLQLIGSIVASSVVEKTGRKPLLAVTSFITGLSMLVLGTWFYFLTTDVLLPAWIPLTAMGLSIFCDAAGFQPVPYVIMSELFSFQLRGLVTAIIIGSASFMDFVQAIVFDPMIKALGLHTTFWIFSAICFFGTFYTVFFVPETRGKSLDEIYRELGQKSVTKVDDKQIDLEGSTE